MKGRHVGRSAEPADRLPEFTAEGLAEPTEQSDDVQAERHLADQRPPDVISFTGYLGDLVPGLTADTAAWRVLYLTSELNSWLMVRESSILLHDRLADGTAAFGQRDVIWVTESADILRGNAPPSIVAQSEFLKGDFTRASDYAASLSGLSGSAQTGAFCGAVTPACRIGRRP